MGDSITIKAILDSTGFAAGSKRLEGAVKGLGNAAKNVGNTVQRSFNSMMGSVKRIVPMLIGVGSAYGIISRAVSAFMAENKALSSQMSSIWSSLGSLLGPIITQIISWISTAVSWFLQFLKLLGVASAGAKKAAKAAGGGAAALQRTVAGFDELNKLQDNGGGGGGGAGKISDKELPDWLKKMADLLKKKEFEEAGRLLARQLNNLVASIDWAGIGKKLYEGLHGALQFLHGALDEFDWTALGKALYDLLTNIDFKQLIKDFGTLLFDAIKGAIKFAWGLLGNDDDSLLQPLMKKFDELKKIVDNTIDRISSAISTLWTNVKPKIEWFITNGIPKIIDVLGELIDLIGDFADLLSGKVNFTEFTNGLSDMQKNMLAVAAALLAISGAVKAVNILNTLSKLFGIIFGKAGLLKTALGALKSAFGWLIGPIGVVVAVVAVLAAAFKHLWETNEEFQKKITGIWEGIKESASTFVAGLKSRFEELKPIFEVVTKVLRAIWEGFCQILAPIFEGAFETVKEVFDLVSGAILGILDTFIGIFTGDWDRAWEGVKSIFTSIWDFILSLWDTIVTTLKKVADKFLGFFGTDWDTLWSNVSTKASDVWNDLKQWFSDLWGNLSETLAAWKESFPKSWGELWDLVSSTAEDIWKGIKEGWPKVWESLSSTITSWWGTITGAVSDVWNSIINSFKSVFGLGEGGESSTFSDFAKGILNGLKSGLEAAWGLVSGAIEAVWNGIINGFKSLFGLEGEGESTKFKEFATGILNGLKTGLESAWATVSGAISAIWDGIISGFKSLFGIGEGDSSIFEGFGGNIVEGLKKGIGKAWNAALESIKSLWEGIKTGFKSVLGIGEGSDSSVFDGFGGKVVNGLSKGIGTAWNAASSTIQSLWGGISSGFKSVLGMGDGDGSESVLSGLAGKMITGMADKISSAWDSVKGTVEKVWSAVKDGATKIWNWLFGNNEDNQGETVVESASDAAIQGSETAQSTIDAIWGSIDQGVATAIQNITTNITTFVTDNTEALTSFSTDAQSAFDSAMTEMGSAADTFTSDTQSSFKTMESDVTANLNSTLTNIKTTWSEALSVTRSRVSDIGSFANRYFTSLANAAWTWGNHLVINLNNGIVAAWNTLQPTIAAVAAMIRSYLGFSEPEKGPLSDFHTYMPDMMKLMAKGIEDNIPLAERAAANVARAVSDEIQEGDYAFGEMKAADFEGAMGGFADRILEGFAKLMERMQEIADNVTFSMPTVAGGGILPYGVDSNWEGLNRSEEGSEMIEAIQELKDLVTDFRNAVDSMTWVAQFGDLRAVVQRVSTIQKQIERAKG